MRVYADNAATTYISETAMNTLVDCLKNYNSNPNSLHTEGQITAEKLAESREKVAKAINAANPNEIYFTSGGSEADNQALLSAARVLKDKGKKHLVSLNIEHHAILHTLKKLEKEGFEVTLLAPESNGIVDVNKVRDAIREDTALVSIMFANNELVNVIAGGAQDRGMRAGTCNVPGDAALAAALEEGVANMEANAKKTAALRDRLIQGLSDIPHSKLNGDPVKRLPGNVNYSFEGVEGESLLLALDEEGIRCSSGSACTSESLDPSHVLMGMGVPVEAAHGSLRFSLNEENTEEEVDYIIEKVHEIVALYRKMSPFWEELEKGEREHVI